MSSALKLDSVSVRFGAAAALDSFCHDFPVRGVSALVGPNGAGKSTLLDVLTGALGTSSGTISLGRHVRSLSRRDLIRLAARLHQAVVIPPALAASRYLAVAADPRASGWILGRRPIPVARPHPADEILEAAAVDQSVPIGSLSWGQQRAVALAAVVRAPKAVLLLDEPLAGLSLQAAGAALRVMRLEGARRLVIVADHDIDQISSIASETVVISSGRRVAHLAGGRVDRDRLVQFFGR